MHGDSFFIVLIPCMCNKYKLVIVARGCGYFRFWQARPRTLRHTVNTGNNRGPVFVAIKTHTQHENPKVTVLMFSYTHYTVVHYNTENFITYLFDYLWRVEICWISYSHSCGYNKISRKNLKRFLNVICHKFVPNKITLE